MPSSTYWYLPAKSLRSRYDTSSASQASARSRPNVPLTTAQPRRRTAVDGLGRHRAGGDVGEPHDRPDLLAALPLGDDLGHLGAHRLLGLLERAGDVADPGAELGLGLADGAGMSQVRLSRRLLLI